LSVWRRRRSGFPKFSGKLFKAARTTRNVEVAMSGDPVKWMKRLINIFIGRKIVKRIYRR
jgi:hypothetical protein